MKKFIVLVLTLALTLLAATSVAAQDDSADYPVDTITVSGIGSASGSPDMANIELGVENFNTDIGEAFSQTNTTLQAVIDAVVNAGVAREDIRTTGLSIFSRESFGAPMPTESGMAGEQIQREYSVANRIRVTVRDVSLLENVITAAITAGANNIFGPEFGFSDRAGLEQSARETAMANARERAQQLADLAGVSLGEIVIVNEGQGGFNPFDVMNMSIAQEGMGGGGAVIEPGQLSVTVGVQVTFRIIR